MNAQHQPTAQPTGVIERLIHGFSDWLRQRRDFRELNQLDGADFDRIASELQIAPIDLERLVHQGPHAADQLPLLLQALGIDEAALARAEPLVLRDMGRVCALCQEKGRCVRDLAEGTSAAQYTQYCLNAPTLRALDQTWHDACVISESADQRRPGERWHPRGRPCAIDSCGDTPISARLSALQ